MTIFTCYLKHGKGPGKKSGGTAIMIKKYWCQYVKVKEGSSTNVLWCLIDKLLLGENVLLGSVYIPPENSPYSNINLFAEIEDDITNFYCESIKEFIVAGDFNARCGQLNDMEDCDYLSEAFKPNFPTEN